MAVRGMAVVTLVAGCASGNDTAAVDSVIYNPTIDNGTVIVCKRVATGTRVKKSVCLSQSQWDKLHRESLEYLARNDEEVRL